MPRAFDLRIGDVAARTGLSVRMIRHYERLGLIAPARTESGQRVFDTETLATLAKIQLLKRAGMKLENIGQWLTGASNARSLIAAQLDLMEEESKRIAQSVALLKKIDQRLAAGDAADTDILAQIINAGQNEATQERAAAFFQRHFSDEQQAEWSEMTERLRAEVDPTAYDNAWTDLANDIKAALPLDPASAKAASFLDRWDKLLEPFQKVATEEQRQLAGTMWSNVKEWGENYNQPVTQPVVDFINTARAVRRKTSN